MAGVDKRQIEHRISSLEGHLEQENPVLLQVVRSFRELDKVAYRLGLMERNDSYATRVPWWPLISLLGTFSSGKSSFTNHYLGSRLQSTGNQAVDDKFTVICYSGDDTPRTLPGLALDADPRFPFYQISADIEHVASGEGKRVDSYLQLKTCHSKRLKGKILIDSPGFDADDQRTSTLRITDHIIDLSDLVLVFFDARHPEPGAMHDTLDHLVADTIRRPDANKFMYILNQIDTTAREDNPEEVFAAWQRALAQKGLTAGRFYRIYNPEAAVPIEDPSRRARFESKRDVDMAEIHGRMHQVEVERAYRIIGVLEKTAKRIENELVPILKEARKSWRRRVLWSDGVVFGLLALVLLGASVQAGYWEGLRFNPPWLPGLLGNPWGLVAVLVVLVAAAGYLHYTVRRLAAKSVIRGLRHKARDGASLDSLVNAFRRNSGPLRSIFGSRPVGWGRSARRRILRVLSDADRYVQTLNDQFTNPSGLSGNAGETHQAPSLGAMEEDPTDKEHAPQARPAGEREPASRPVEAAPEVVSER